MKRTAISIIALTLCVLVAAISFSGCGSAQNDSGDRTETAKNAGSELFGSWDSQEAPGTIYSFGADGKGMLNASGVPMEFEYTDKGGAVEITYTDSATMQRFEYTVKDDILSLKDLQTDTTVTYKKK